MKSLLNFFRRPKRIPNSAIDDVFENPFFKDINYPILVTISIFIIYRDAISKFYAIDFSIIDMEAELYDNPILIKLAKHIKDRIYNENYSYIYHLQNLNKHETVRYLDLGIDDMFQKVCTNVIHNNKDFKEYLELILFGPSEPFLENIEDLDKI